MYAAERKRLRLAAVAVVLVLTAGAGYNFARTRPTYAESATVVFSLPKDQNGPNAYLVLASSLITSSEAMTQILMSPHTQRQIREAGGTASVSLPLVNLHNEEFPYYGVPLATLATTSRSAASTHHTFVIAARQLDRLLASRQARPYVPPRNRISAQLIGDTGPVVQKGSPKRMLAGLMILALVAVSALWSFIDRKSLSKNHATALYQ